jgi:hypothetical protein
MNVIRCCSLDVDDSDQRSPWTIGMNIVRTLAFTDAAQQWLQAHSTHLAAAGYPWDALLQQLRV